MQIHKKHIYNSLLFIGSVLLLIGPSFTNGFPLLFTDSETFLISGQIDYVPVDNSIIYGLFVRHISLSWSIWLVILTQSLLFNFILLQFFRHFVKTKLPYLFLFLSALFLSFFTGIGYYCAQIHLDIFTSIMILGIFLIYYLPQKELLKILFLCVIVGFSIICSLTHLTIAIALIGSLILIELVRKFKKKTHAIKSKRIYALVITIGISLLSLASINYTFDAGFRLSRASNIVIGAKMIESGLVNKHLKRSCADKEFHPPYIDLCNYIDQFNQWPTAKSYMHLQSSPLYEGGCNSQDWITCWTDKNSAYGDLVSNVLKESDLRNEYLASVITSTLKQLIIFRQSDINPKSISDIFIKYYEIDSYHFENSKQRKETLSFNNQNKKETFIVDLSFILILLFLFKCWHSIDYQAKLFAIFILISLITNAFVCTTFSNVLPQNQGRIIFLIPLLLILLALRYLSLNIKKYKLSLSDLFMGKLVV